MRSGCCMNKTLLRIQGSTDVNSLNASRRILQSKKLLSLKTLTQRRGKRTTKTSGITSVTRKQTRTRKLVVWLVPIPCLLPLQHSTSPAATRTPAAESTKRSLTLKRKSSWPIGSSHKARVTLSTERGRRTPRWRVRECSQTSTNRRIGGCSRDTSQMTKSSKIK